MQTPLHLCSSAPQPPLLVVVLVLVVEVVPVVVVELVPVVVPEELVLAVVEEPPPPPAPPPPCDDDEVALLDELPPAPAVPAVPPAPPLPEEVTWPGSSVSVAPPDAQPIAKTTSVKPIQSPIHRLVIARVSIRGEIVPEKSPKRESSASSHNFQR